MNDEIKYRLDKATEELDAARNMLAEMKHLASCSCKLHRAIQHIASACRIMAAANSDQA